MLTEDDVVLAVLGHLEASAWNIVSHALATQHGDDIVATRDGRTLRSSMDVFYAAPTPDDPTTYLVILRRISEDNR